MSFFVKKNLIETQFGSEIGFAIDKPAVERRIDMLRLVWSQPHKQPTKLRDVYIGPGKELITAIMWADIPFDNHKHVRAELRNPKDTPSRVRLVKGRIRERTGVAEVELIIDVTSEDGTSYQIEVIVDRLP